MFVLKALHGLAPEYILYLLQVYQTTNPLRSFQTLYIRIRMSFIARFVYTHKELFIQPGFRETQSSRFRKTLTCSREFVGSVG